jgi:hypothetical protein
MLNQEALNNAVVVSSDEQWADIPGYVGSYQISNRGRVQSLNRVITAVNQVGPYSYPIKGRLLVVKTHQSGHMVVRLSKPGEKRKELAVHRLVAAAFVDGQQPGWIVIHKDSNKENYEANNLEWKSNWMPATY